MQNWIFLLTAIVYSLVVSLTIYYYRKNNKSSGKKSKATGIITQYWQAIVLSSLGVILLVVYIVI